MNKYAEYKEAYKTAIMDELIKQAKYEKAINPAKVLWKDISGKSRKHVNKVLKEKGVLLPNYDSQLIANAERLSEGTGVDFKSIMNMLGRKGDKGLSGRSLFQNYSNTGDRIEQALFDKKYNLNRGSTYDDFLKVDALQKLLNRYNRRQSEKTKESLSNSQLLNKILGIGTGIGAVGTGYGLLKD